MVHKIGPKGQQIRALREKRAIEAHRQDSIDARIARKRLAEKIVSGSVLQRQLDTMTGTANPKPSSAPVQASAQPKETTVKRKTATKRAAKSARKTSKSIARRKIMSDARGKTKVQIIAGMLQSPQGCTTAQVLEATGWPAVSMPQQAKAAGLTLTKEKVEGVTVYRGTPSSI